MQQRQPREEEQATAEEVQQRADAFTALVREEGGGDKSRADSGSISSVDEMHRIIFSGQSAL